MKISEQSDRFWLFTIAGFALVVIGAIVLVTGFSSRELTPERLALLTSVATGLLMLVQKVVEAQQTRRMADQLHASTPVPAAQDAPPPPPPADDAAPAPPAAAQPVTVVNTAEAPVPVEPQP